MTRRNVGQTLADYHDKQKVPYANLHFINVMRQHMDLPQLMERPEELRRTTPYKITSPSLFARLRCIPVEWFWWIVAALKSPFLSAMSPSPLVDTDALKALTSGDKSINKIRSEMGFDPVEVDNA